MSERQQYPAVPNATLSVPWVIQAKVSLNSREMSFLTLRGFVVDLNRRSTSNDEDLGEVADPSGHGTWVDEGPTRDHLRLGGGVVPTPHDVEGRRGKTSQVRDAWRLGSAASRQLLCKVCLNV